QRDTASQLDARLNVAPPTEEEIPTVLPVARVAGAERSDAPVEPNAPGLHAVQPRPPVTVPPWPPAAPPAPRRTFGEMLAGFMEERNILWGELVGGLLIVGCSIALVISLRKTLEQIPYFPFLAIGTVTAALIGAGRYTLSHWKLESTSRGLL